MKVGVLLLTVVGWLVCTLVSNSTQCTPQIESMKKLLFKGKEKPKRAYPPKSIEDLTDYHRVQYRKTNSCTCGVPNSNFPNAYNLFVYGKIGPGNLWTSCAGAILTSNLVAVSHRCFLYPNTTLMPYESWNVTGERHTVPLRDIVVSTANNRDGVQYTVKGIIFNPQYTLHAPSNPFIPKDDLALLVMETNLFDSGHYSVCLPQFRSQIPPTPPDVFLQEAVYFGMGGEHLTEDRTKEVRIVQKLLTLKAKQCDEEANLGLNPDDDTICVRFRAPPPRHEGGILLTPSSDKAVFLLGLASKIGMTMKGTGLHYAFFTNAFASSSFVDYHAHREKSVWCSQPAQGYRPWPKNDTQLQPNIHPWEKQFTPIPRDESLDCVCGIQNEGGVFGRVSGGVESVPYEYPWTVSLFLNFDAGAQICGGSIINNRMVVTAAHCVVVEKEKKIKEIIKEEKITLIIRAHKFIDPTDPNTFASTVAKVLIHPDYEKSLVNWAMEHDIALLILKDPLEFVTATKTYAKALRPICLPSTGLRQELVGKDAVVAGWGLTNKYNPNSFPTALQKLTVPILPLDACTTATVLPITDNNLCAGHMRYENNSQKGDSGGPLMLQNEEKMWTLVGVVSWGAWGYDEEAEYLGDYSFYVNLQNNYDVIEYLPYIDYIAERENAKWCRTTKYVTFPRSS